MQNSKNLLQFRKITKIRGKQLSGNSKNHFSLRQVRIFNIIVYFNNRQKNKSYIEDETTHKIKGKFFEEENDYLQSLHEG